MCVDGAEAAWYMALESDLGSKSGSALCVTLGTWLNLSESPLLVCQERLPVLMLQD